MHLRSLVGPAISLNLKGRGCDGGLIFHLRGQSCLSCRCNRIIKCLLACVCERRARRGLFVFSQLRVGSSFSMDFNNVTILFS